MGDIEYLKKLKEALEKGVQNDDVTNMHYDILKGADLEQKIRLSKAKDNDLYTNEIIEYTKDIKRNDGISEENIIKERKHYNEDIKDFIGNDMPKDVTEKLTSQAKVLAQFEADRIRKEQIELSEHQIKLLNEDSNKLRAKIQKNNELVQFLMNELTKI